MTNTTTTTETTLLDAARQELNNLSARWNANDLPNNPVRQALNDLSVWLEENETTDADEFVSYLVEQGVLTRTQADEVLARTYGYDGDVEVREDGARADGENVWWRNT